MIEDCKLTINIGKRYKWVFDEALKDMKNKKLGISEWGRLIILTYLKSIHSNNKEMSQKLTWLIEEIK